MDIYNSKEQRGIFEKEDKEMDEQYERASTIFGIIWAFAMLSVMAYAVLTLP